MSKEAKRSLRILTSSLAVTCDDRAVKPTMSANRMLREKKKTRQQSGTFVVIVTGTVKNTVSRAEFETGGDYCHDWPGRDRVIIVRTCVTKQRLLIWKCH